MAGMMEKSETGPANIVGISMVGTIALQLALEYPQLVEKLILVSTFAVLCPDTLSEWLYFLQRFILVNTLGLPGQVKLPDSQNEPFHRILVDSIMKADLYAYRAVICSLGLFNIVERLREIKVPTLLVNGTKDTIVPPARQPHLREGISGAKQVIDPNTGHAMNMDHPETFNSELIAILRER